MERKELGQIQHVTFGYGGYQDAMIGLSFTLGGQGWGVCDFKGAWSIKRSEHAQWTEASRDAKFAATVHYLNDLLRAAKKQHVAQLQGTPIEATFNGNQLVSWRVLAEVL